MNKTKKKIYSFKLIAPWLILYLLFFISPGMSEFYFAFTNWDVFHAKFIGLGNFTEIFNDPNITIAFRNTFLFTFVTVVLKIVISLSIAILLNQKLKTQSYLRAAYFFPAIMTYVATGLIFKAILHPQQGILNAALRGIGLDAMAQDWLVDPTIIVFSLAMIEVWKTAGFHFAIFLAGLQSISSDYYESASIDGATSWQKFKWITFPLLSPTFTANFLFALIGGLKVFDLVMATTGGGPGYSSEVIGTFVFRSFTSSRYGLASAGELLLFVIVVAATLASRYFLQRRESSYGYQ